MQVPAGGFARAEQALQAIGSAGLVGAHAAHGIVLGGPHGDKLVQRIDAQKVLADLVHLAQLGADVLLAKVPDVQPQVLAVGTLHALAGAHVLDHAARDHVARGQFRLVRLVVGHEAVFVAVQQGAAVATAAFGNQNVGGHGARGVKLHGFHVAEFRHAGIQRQRQARPFADDGVGRGAVDAPVPAGCHQRGPREVGTQFAGAQAAHDGPVAGFAVVDQRDGFRPVVHGHAKLRGAVVHGVQHRVARAVGRVAGAPLGRAAEGARVDEAVVFGLFGGLEGLAALPVGVRARHNTVPRHPPVGQAAHFDGGRFHEHAGHFLVRAPVGAFHGVQKVHVGAVAVAHDGVAKGSLHAALRGHGMRAPRGHQ